jgi:hypothetical protein
MMREWISPSSRAWALAAVIGGIALLLGVEVIDQPDATALDLLLELINITPIVMTPWAWYSFFRWRSASAMIKRS